jgi:hypothetical protein
MDPQDKDFKNIYKENLSFNNVSFVVCSMFTPDKPVFFQYADRLVRSCEKFKLPYIIYTAPQIHKSLSPVGDDNPAYTRTNLIKYNLAHFPDKNVLCVDTDMFFMDYPGDIARASDSGYDFAVYNWLNDAHNEAYMPINRTLAENNRLSDFYLFSHCIGYSSSEQLISSGGVQFYRNSSEAKYLLDAWQAFIVSNPDFAEDQCLDFVYNNFIIDKRNIKVFWFDKSYLRFPWWPHIRPVIIHSGLPSGNRSHLLTEINSRLRFYPERCTQKKWTDLIFPKDCIIDTKAKLLLKIFNNQIVDQKPVQHDFWIYPENIGLEEDKPADRAGNDATYNKSSITATSLVSGKPSPNIVPKAGRNDPCPCGSGEKYKKCCSIL